MWMLTVLALTFTFLVGHGDLKVALYGFRITAIHFPVLFIIGHLLDKEDVLKMGKVLLWMNIGMTFLVALQFFSPQTAWINRGIGGLEGSGFGGAGGFKRVPGTFSFTSGLSKFYGITTAFIFYYWLIEKKDQVPRLLLWGSSLALLAAIPLTISRTVLFQALLAFTFMIVISGKDFRVIKRIIGFSVGGLGLFFILSSFSFFETANTAFLARLENANVSEGGLEGTFIDRFLGSMFGAIINSEVSIFGLGLGMGTAVGSHLLTGDRMMYLIAEGEWGRLIGEMGLFIGILVIFLRLSLMLELLSRAWKALGRQNALPWMLLSFGALSLLHGQWAQPTNLGFTIFIGGIIIASFKNAEA